MSYTQHPSQRLRTHFENKPWQGNDPSKARFLFVGLDANYDKNIEETLPEIFDYLNDGVDYWRKNGVHHPFRLDRYRGNGKRYHNKFAQIGFTPKHAELVSFVELLHEPTTGRSRLTRRDLALDHLLKLEIIFNRSAATHVFLSKGVANLMKQVKIHFAGKIFSWLPQDQLETDGDLQVVRKHNGQITYQMCHFSVHYEPYLSLLNKQITQIGEIVQMLDNNMGDSKDFIQWFWKEFRRVSRLTAHDEGLCQCASEQFIDKTDRPTLMRSFLILSVFIDQMMYTHFQSAYREFRSHFYFPKLYSHQGSGMARPSWFIYSCHGFDKKMDWQTAVPVANAVLGDLLTWLENYPDGHEMVQKFRMLMEREIKTDFDTKGAKRLLEIISQVGIYK